MKEARFFPKLRSYPYRFVSDEVRERHHQITNTPRPGVILYELRDLLSGFYDVSQVELVPRSKYQPEMLLEPVRKYGEGGKMPSVHWDALYKAVQRVRRKFRKVRGVKPIPLESVPYEGTSNSGLPYLCRKQDVAEESLRRAQACIQGACPPPMTMFSRGKNLEESRAVEAGAFEWQLVEGMFFYPLQEAIMRQNTPYMGGVAACDIAGSMNEISYHPFVLAMDYSGYDGSISGWLINSGFLILRSCLSLDQEQERLWSRIVSFFITCPILCPDQRVYYGKDHGVPSGSMFTQMIDSIVNMIIIEYVALRTNLQIGKYYVLGDDSVVGCDTVPSVKDLAHAAWEIGITVNERKTHVSDTSRDLAIHFLGHTYERGLPSRPVDETIRKLLCPERIDYRMFSKDRSVRAAYYRERIRAYQEDNSSSDAWKVLRFLEVLVANFGRDLPRWRLLYEAEMDGLARRWFSTTEKVERDRWDPKRYAARHDDAGRYPDVRPAVWWL